MMDRVTYPVIIEREGTARRYSAEFQRKPEHAPAWRAVLLRSYGLGTVTCTCSGTGPKRLSIRCRSDADTFHLARYPDSGPDHAQDCIYWAAEPTSSGLAGYQHGVVQELEDGGVRIRLKRGLQRRAIGEASDEDELFREARAPGRRGAGRSAMTLLGLLHFVWTQSGFNTWAPSMAGKRNLGLVHYHLVKAAADILAGRVRLASALLVATSQAAGAQAARNRAAAQAAAEHSHRLIVIAPLARFREGADSGKTLPIAGFHGIPHLTVAPTTWSDLEKRFGAEVGAWRKGASTIAILQSDVPVVSGHGIRAAVLDVALMRVTADWIPVDSAYEAHVADWLVRQRRRFEKPLRFDAGTEHVFPDFWLRDVGSPYPMEVFGMTDADYLRRKAEKIQYYDREYGNGSWWTWDAAAGQLIPAVPPASLPFRAST